MRTLLVFQESWSIFIILAGWILLEHLSNFLTYNFKLNHFENATVETNAALNKILSTLEEL